MQAEGEREGGSLPELLAGLNEAQRRAVEHEEGPLLVVAGAGTGKTRVITARIVRLLEEHPHLDPSHIIGLTFTDKAAAEMKSRVMQLAGERGAGVRLSTFHAFCQAMLDDVEPGLQVLDDNQHWVLLRRNIARLELEHFRRVAEPGEFLSAFVKFFSRCQDELVSPDDYDKYVDKLEADFCARENELDPDPREQQRQEVLRQRELARVYRVSEALLLEKKLVTYGGQLLRAAHLLRTNPALRELQQQRCRYLLVDEFQDTNMAQIELLALLAGEQRNVFVVGDDDQAIYRFRGASFGTFGIFARDFLKLPKEKAREASVGLLENYRSTPRILRAANQVIRQNSDRFLPQKNLFAKGQDGEKLRLAEFATAAEEAEWIAQEILALHGRGYAWKDFAVLYRAHHHRNLLVERLAAHGIPFEIPKLDVLEHGLVRDVVAYLNAIVHPHDNVAFARVLAMPAWGFAAEDLVRLAQRAGSKQNLQEALAASLADPKFAASARNGGTLLQFLRDLRDRAAHLPAVALFDLLLAELGLMPAGGDPPNTYVNTLREFVKKWAKLPITEGETLREFLDYLELFALAGGTVPLAEKAPDDAVQLLTAHGAKGLEFTNVFAMRLSKGSFPTSEKRVKFEFPPELYKEELPVGGSQVQEERRLFYVAMTRARRRLTLTYLVNNRNKQSPFIEDILEDAQIKKEDVVQLAPKVNLAAAPPRREFTPPPDSRVHSRIAEWAEAFHPPLGRPLMLSHGKLDAYDSCPQKFLFGYGWGVRGRPNAALTFGSVMHNMVQRISQSRKEGSPMPLAEAERQYLESWRSAGFQDDYHEEEYRKDGLRQLRLLYRRLQEAPDDILFLEKEFTLPLENDIVITGRIDQIHRVPGGVEVLDYKTGKAKEDKDARKSLQLILYFLAAREALELNPLRAGFHSLVSDERVFVAPDEKRIQRKRDKVQALAAEMRAGQFEANPGSACRICDFKPLCPAYEKLTQA